MSRNITTHRETERTETDPPEDRMNATTDQTNVETNSDGDHIQIESLRKTFDDGTIVACDDVNIDIDEGEFVILVGPSGCGKTTTLRCIAGLEEPDKGRILVDGEDITGRKSKDRNLAFVFQSIALFPHMSVRKNIRFGLDMNTISARTKRISVSRTSRKRSGWRRCWTGNRARSRAASNSVSRSGARW